VNPTKLIGDMKQRKMRFTKMHGTGNDYVFVDCFSQRVTNPAKVARAISDRHFGIGSDGLILICPSRKADVRMRIFNADGSEAEMCGNGIRCVAKYVYEHKLAKPSGAVVMGTDKYARSLSVETGRGVLTLGLAVGRDKKVHGACVNMGQPILKAKEIPVRLTGKTVIEQPIRVLGQRLVMTCVSMGNPHAVFFCNDVEEIELERLGPAIENHRLFPNRTNVHFVEVDSTSRIKMRTWERGSGITLACGTGACASCVAGVLTEQCDRSCAVKLPGGQLQISWSKADSCVYMTGPAMEVFTGEWAGG